MTNLPFSDLLVSAQKRNHDALHKAEVRDSLAIQLINKVSVSDGCGLLGSNFGCVKFGDVS